MADTSIRDDFVEGVQEIFETLFNDGVNDGIDLYLLSTKTEPNIYDEQKYKVYKKPVRLVCNAHLEPKEGESVEVIKSDATFKVPLKALLENDIDVNNLDYLQKAVIKFKEVFYEVTIVKPTTYVEDVFLLYTFECLESKQITKVRLEPERVGR